MFIKPLNEYHGDRKSYLRPRLTVEYNTSIKDGHNFFGKGIFGGKEQFLGGSCLYYDTYRKMTAAKNSLLIFGGQRIILGALDGYVPGQNRTASSSHFQAARSANIHHKIYITVSTVKLHIVHNSSYTTSNLDP